MQSDRRALAAVWLANAREDYDVGAEIADRHPARACFHAQQAAEMALKSWLVSACGDAPRVHPLAQLLAELTTIGETIDSQLSDAIRELDVYYAATRYPDALGGADPRGIASVATARRALSTAAACIELVASQLSRDE